MPEPLPLTLRVSVRGPSTVGWSAPMGGPRTDMTFSRVIERELSAAGRPTLVRTQSVGGEATVKLVREWEREYTGWSPDVLIMLSGQYETLHLLWPNWLERHANSLTWSPRPWNSFYRKRVLRPLWRALFRLQSRIDGQRVWLNRWRLRFAVADVQKTIANIRQVGSPLVIVMHGTEPSSIGQRMFPGMAPRVRYLNDRLSEMVAGFGTDEVRIFPTEAVVREFVARHHDGDHDAALQDGFHYSPPLHDEIGRRLAAEIESWAQTQTHLKPPT